jgi:hypothetical protein
MLGLGDSVCIETEKVMFTKKIENNWTLYQNFFSIVQTKFYQ